MKYEQAHQPLHCAPFLPPHPKKSEMLLQTTHSCSSVSYKVQRPGYWEDLQFNNTSMLASWGLWFLKEKVASQREKERDKEKEKEREREYFHWVTQRAFCQTSWADLQRWWRKRLSRRKGWAGEGSASRGALTRPPPSFCVYRDRRPPGNRRRYVIDQVLLQAERSYC